MTKGNWRYIVSSYSNGLLINREHFRAFGKAEALFKQHDAAKLSATLMLKDGSVMRRCSHD